MERLLFSKVFELESGTAEDVIWRNEISPKITFPSENVRSICAYGFTEMLNNVIDHSESNTVLIEVYESATYIKFRIDDAGVGIFRKLKQALNLSDEREAVFELTKGKVTTDPDRHSGEGVFFTSRMFDSFYIMSGELLFSHEGEENEDWLTEHAPHSVDGTAVRMTVDKNTTRTAKEVFDKYTSPDGPGFTKTHVPLKLAQYGEEQLTSRSQAKRVLSRFDKFSEVFLDFDGVKTIGQGFADEIFRVYRIQHPEISLYAVRANEDVENMIKRAIAGITPEPHERQKTLPFDPLK